VQGFDQMGLTFRLGGVERVQALAEHRQQGRDAAGNGQRKAQNHCRQQG